MGRIDAAQHVVGAEFQNDAIGAVRHRPVEPLQPVRGRVAGDAGIGDVDVEAIFAQRPCSTFGKALSTGSM